MFKVLVVDDEPEMGQLLTDILTARGFEVALAEDGAGALQRIGHAAPSAILLDLKMPNLDGMQVLEQIKLIAPHVPVIILTAYGDIPTVVEAMRLGADDYLTKPFGKEEVVLALSRALERSALLAEVEALRAELSRRGHLQELMGSSREIQKVIQQVQQVGDSPFTVLIQGETGTGKELVARAIHEQSARREKLFIALDCGAIPETLIESELFGYERGAFTGADRRKEGHFTLAEGGSLFLDEIANLPLTTQSKLLRVLQERQVQPLGAKHAVPLDVRIIAASNVPLEAEMRAGRFRQDLYYRLNEFTISLPPLRERQSDIIYLAKRFLAEAGMELRRPVHGVSDEAIQPLLQYPWPGNVRELRNVIRQAVLLSPGLIKPEHLTGLGAGAYEATSADEPLLESVNLSFREAVRNAVAEAERRVIRQALQAARGRRSEAARLLGIDYKTLHLRLKRYSVSVREFPPSQSTP